MADKAAGQVITFYSYKGGAGRSMALVNTACLLSQEQFGGKRVLMVDWDLEAPGLHLFFHNRVRLSATNSDHEYPWNYRGRTDMTTVVVDQKYLTKLRSLLVEYFNEEELRDLCFTMGIDYESLPGEGMKGKTREILTFLERHNRIPELVEVVRDSRPDLDWEELDVSTSW